jgi:hypothetical protein
MYNTDLPTRAELPTSKQLMRSTLIAIASAAAILVTIVLPAEYNLDPTGIGKALGLAEMGEIKAQLADEAEQDRLKSKQSSALVPAINSTSTSISGLISGLFMSSAHAQEVAATRNDEMNAVLKPGEGVEIKMVMMKGAEVSFSWSIEGGVVNFDMHADGGGQEISYEKGRGIANAEGKLVAEFDGNHGWFWRNRGTADVTLTLKTDGAYTDIKQMM